ncbi:MAG: CHRD domain-containing protein [Ignavibacteriales bacterium]|nr:CHRD domain-containing protein [Ignavibacteriales bacterium]
MKSVLRVLGLLLGFSASLISQEIFFRIALDSTATGGNSPGRGTGFAILSNDKKSLRYDITVNKLNGNITAAHFHYAPVGVVHPITFTGKTATGTWNDIPDSLVDALFMEQEIYVNVHTSTAGGGEIRGTPQAAQFGFPMVIDGASAGKTSPGRGTGYVTFENNSTLGAVTEIHYRATYAGLQGNITAAHFHSFNGGGVFHPVTFVDSTLDEMWTTNIPDSAILLFAKRQAYLNIHTSKEAGGEIRGNPSFVGEIPLFGILDGAQAGTASTGKGTSWAVLRPDLSVMYNATYAKLVGTFSAAHFHTSDGGGVIHPVSFSSNHTSGTWSNLSDKNLQDLLKGRVYLNVHSSTNAGGEIRATMNVRGGFTAQLDNIQASTSSTAKGTAWMYFTDSDSLQYHATFAGLNGTFSAAHFHTAVTGGVIHPLTFTDSTTSGGWDPGNYWLDLIRGKVYINVHSSIAAGGEIRGNFGLGSGVATTVREIFSSTPKNFSLDQNYPNPFNPSTTIRFSVPTAGLTTLKVYDLLGKEVATLINGEQKIGSFEVKFDASRLSSGLYFYQLRSGSFIQSKKMMLIK